MPFKDPEKRRIKQAEYSKKYYEANKKAVIKKINAKKKVNRAWFTAYKATLSCIICGENHPAALDFHHKKPQKTDKKVNDLVSDGHTKIRIQAEIDKCEVLCSNCHRKHHHDEREARKKVAKSKN
jgi:hypothetical protein